MFDVGFWELALLAVIGLVVLGPERLPGVARTLGFWAGRARMYMRNLSNELEQEVNTAELRRSIESTRDEIEQGGRRLESEVRGEPEGRRLTAETGEADDTGESSETGRATETGQAGENEPGAADEQGRGR